MSKSQEIKKSEQFNYKNLSPFKWFVLENFPFIEEDFDALTEYELYCKIVEYLNKVIASTNELGGQVETVTNALITLENYVDNYFKNLDVQDEINNKLNDMASDGTLEQIINQEIFGQINMDITNLKAKDVNLQTQINILKNKRYILLGDSYGVGWTPEGIVESWAIKFKNYMGLSDTNCYIAVENGAGLKKVGGGGHTITQLLQNLDINEPSGITNIIYLGGYNDRQQSDLSTALNNFYNTAHTKCPNALVQIGMVSNVVSDTIMENLYGVIYPIYRAIAEKPQGMYLENMETILHVNSFRSSDLLHPKENGQQAIARGLVNAIKNGICTPYNFIETVSITLNKNVTNWSSNKIDFGVYGSDVRVKFFNSTLRCNNMDFSQHNGTHFINIGTWQQWILQNQQSLTNLFDMPVLVKIGNRYYDETAIIKLGSESIDIALKGLNENNSGYLSGIVTEIIFTASVYHRNILLMG